jgi:hypothetical protein
MRTIEIPGGLNVFISNLENKVYERLSEEVCKEDLNERDAYIAQNLVNKGVCSRLKKEGKIYFKKSQASFK